MVDNLGRDWPIATRYHQRADARRLVCDRRCGLVAVIRFPLIVMQPRSALAVEAAVAQMEDVIEAVEDLLVVGDRDDRRLLLDGNLAQ